MARKHRIYIPGAMYHVIARGNGGQTIFYSNEDRNYFYNLLNETTKRFSYRIHAFCLMSNHVHIALQIGDIPLSKVMQNIMLRYAKWLNKRKHCYGHVFQGRYKAILIDSDSYLLQLIRYIHLNPMRAKIITDIEKYKWSSHRAYLGKQRLSWLSIDLVLGYFAKEKETAMHRYQEFMRSPVNEIKPRLFESGNQKHYEILAEDKFLKRILKTKITEKSSLHLNELIKIVCEYYSVDECTLKSNSRIRRYNKIRIIIAIIAKEMNIATLINVANYFNRDVSGLSRCFRIGLGLDDIPEELRNVINMSICQT